MQIGGIDDRIRTKAGLGNPVERGLGPCPAAAMDFDPIKAIAWLDGVDTLHLGIALDQRHLVGTGLLQNAEHRRGVDRQLIR